MSMRRALRRLAVYFGFAEPEDEDGDGEPEPLRMMVGDLASGAVRLFALAIVATAAMVVVFDWRLADLLAGGVVGAAVFGTIEYLTAIRKQVPSGPLPPAPRDATWGGSDAGVIRRTISAVTAVAALAGLIALVDRIEDVDQLAGIFIPGQFLGYAFALLVAAWKSRGWERRHGLRVASRGQGDELERFAVDPLTLRSA